MRIFALLIVSSFLLGGVGLAWAFDTAALQTNRVTVLAVGGDRAITHSTGVLADEIPFAQVRKVASLDSLALSAERAPGTTIVVGHGEEEGLRVRGEIIPWPRLGDMLSSSPSHTILMAACFSEGLRSSLTERTFFGFIGLVDVDEAALLIASLVYGFRGNFQKVEDLLSSAFEIMTEKAFGISDRPMEVLYHFPYQTKKIREVWHVKYRDSYLNPVEYTHPDNYLHYTYIGRESRAVLGSVSNNLVVGHIPKTYLDVKQLLDGIAIVFAAAVVGGLLAGIIGGLVAGLIAAIILVVGIGIDFIVNNYIRDEAGAGWMWVQNVWSAWWGFGGDFKIGGIMWFHARAVWGIPMFWPLWYGGNYLGLEGW